MRVNLGMFRQEASTRLMAGMLKVHESVVNDAPSLITDQIAVTVAATVNGTPANNTAKAKRMAKQRSRLRFTCVSASIQPLVRARDRDTEHDDDEDGQGR